jgi:hypothetical protein
MKMQMRDSDSNITSLDQLKQEIMTGNPLATVVEIPLPAVVAGERGPSSRS